MRPGDIDAPGGQITGQTGVQDDGRDSHHREAQAVAEHHDQVKNKHDQIDQNRRKLPDQRGNDQLVCGLTLLQISDKTLGIESYRKPQQMTHKSGGVDDSGFPCDAQGIISPDQRCRAPDHRQSKHDQQQRLKPFRQLPGQNVV